MNTNLKRMRRSREVSSSASSHQNERVSPTTSVLDRARASRIFPESAFGQSLSMHPQGLPKDRLAKGSEHGGEESIVRGTPAEGHINILIVDDEPKNLTVLEAVLDDPAYHLVRAESAHAALLALLAEEFALLILDIRMPDIMGLELARLIKQRKKTSQIPIIFLTAYYSEDQHVIDGYGTGAVDYLHKPVNPVVLRSKVAIFAELYRQRRQLELSNRALAAEIASRQQAEEQLRGLNETLERQVTERTRQIEFLLHEVNHRSKNILSLVLAVVKQTAIGDMQEFVEMFTRRITAIAAHQDLLIKGNWQSLDLPTLIRAQLDQFEGLVGERIALDGVPLPIAPPAAQTIGMAVHELATNAIKYGALSGRNGRVDIAWQVKAGTPGDRLTMSWRESGGPPVRAPARRGFGSRVIKDVVEMGLEGNVRLDFGPVGLLWQLDCPLQKILEDGPDEAGQELPSTANGS